MVLLITSVGSTDLSTHMQPAGSSLNFLRPALPVARPLGATREKGKHHEKWGDKETDCLLSTELAAHGASDKYHRFYLGGLRSSPSWICNFSPPPLLNISEQAGAGYSACPRWVTPPDKPDWLQNWSYSASSWDRKKQTANEEMLLPNSSTHHIK